MSLLHIHNGDVMAEHARQAGIPGEHLAFRESLVTGSLTADRAEELARAYGQPVDRIREELTRQERALDDETREVVLWFEEDVYCLIHFLYLLQRVRSLDASYVWSERPLSELDPDALRRLHVKRVAVTPRLRELAAEVWRDYVRGDVARWTEHDTPELPFLREGLTLLGGIDAHLQQLIDEDHPDFHALFARVDRRLGLGDTEVLRRLRALGWQS